MSGFRAEFKQWHRFDLGAERHEGFPRMVRAMNGDILLFSRLGTSHASDPAAIIMRRSADGGLTWGEPVELWRDPGGDGWTCHNPVALVLANGAIVLWVSRYEFAAGRKLDCLLARSNDHGVSWSPFLQFDPDPSKCCYYVTDAVALEDTLVAMSTCFTPSGKEPAFNVCWHGSTDGLGWTMAGDMTPRDVNIGDEVGLVPLGGGELTVLLRGRRERHSTFLYHSRDLGRSWDVRDRDIGPQIGWFQRPFLTHLGGTTWLMTGRRPECTPKAVAAYLSRDNCQTFEGPSVFHQYQSDGAYTTCVRTAGNRLVIAFYSDAVTERKCDMYVGELILEGAD